MKKEIDCENTYMAKQYGKAIYQPKGKAAEYGTWACNFYVGCSNGCEYCYLKKGRSAKVLGGDQPTLKKCFKGEGHALQVFQKELRANIDELKAHGIFFSFTTDPCLAETWTCTLGALNICMGKGVPVKILTKCTDWVDDFLENTAHEYKFLSCYIAFGFTLTGHDELEPGASINQERIRAMKKLHDAGFKTFASIEPIIDLNRSLEMIKQSIGFCDLYKIGLESGKKYDWRDLRGFMLPFTFTPLNSKFYFKDSFIKQAGLDRNNLPVNCVGRDYNLFTNS